MPTVLSTLRRHAVLKSKPEVFETHVALDIDDNGVIMVTSEQKLIKGTTIVKPIPVTTRAAIEWFAAGNGATSGEVRKANADTGLCVFVAHRRKATDRTNDLNGPSYYTSQICRCPQLLTRIANSFFPKFVDTSEIKWFRHLGVDYSHWRTQSAIGEHHDPPPSSKLTLPDSEECCICLDGLPTFRWSGCMHAAGSTGALVCLKCRNRINSHASKVHQKTFCPICRGPGTLVRHTKKTHGPRGLKPAGFTL